MAQNCHHRIIEDSDQKLSLGCHRRFDIRKGNSSDVVRNTTLLTPTLITAAFFAFSKGKGIAFDKTRTDSYSSHLLTPL